MQFLIKIQKPSLVDASINPAIDGPTNLAPLNIRELRAMALPRCSFFSTISITKEWREGMSKELIHPSKMLRAIICHI